MFYDSIKKQLVMTGWDYVWLIMFMSKIILMGYNSIFKRNHQTEYHDPDSRELNDIYEIHKLFNNISDEFTYEQLLLYSKLCTFVFSQNVLENQELVLKTRLNSPSKYLTFDNRGGQILLLEPDDHNFFYKLSKLFLKFIKSYLTDSAEGKKILKILERIKKKIASLLDRQKAFLVSVMKCFLNIKGQKVAREKLPIPTKSVDVMAVGLFLLDGFIFGKYIENKILAIMGVGFVLLTPLATITFIEFTFLMTWLLLSLSGIQQFVWVTKQWLIINVPIIISLLVKKLEWFMNQVILIDKVDWISSQLGASLPTSYAEFPEPKTSLFSGSLEGTNLKNGHPLDLLESNNQTVNDLDIAQPFYSKEKIRQIKDLLEKADGLDSDFDTLTDIDNNNIPNNIPNNKTQN